LYVATRSHFNAYSPAEWNASDVDLILYVLARDNEVEIVKDELERRPEHLASLARHSLASACDHESRWQLAVALAKTQVPESEELLTRYCRDKHEYVRRRALVALASIGSAIAEVFAEEAWATGEQYQRMSALSALHKLKSPSLTKYLRLAEEDGREYLTALAARIRRGDED
jgi:HEAT repeat protein